jgi:hypothetical protein
LSHVQRIARLILKRGGEDWQLPICRIVLPETRILDDAEFNETKGATMRSMIYRVPLFGWMVKEAVHGPTTAKVLFVLNLLMAWLLAILTFGYPAIILPALTAVPVMFVVLILITKG